MASGQWPVARLEQIVTFLKSMLLTALFYSGISDTSFKGCIGAVPCLGGRVKKGVVLIC